MLFKFKPFTNVVFQATTLTHLVFVLSVARIMGSVKTSSNFEMSSHELAPNGRLPAPQQQSQQHLQHQQQQQQQQQQPQQQFGSNEIEQSDLDPAQPPQQSMSLWERISDRFFGEPAEPQSPLFASGSSSSDASGGGSIGIASSFRNKTAKNRNFDNEIAVPFDRSIRFDRARPAAAAAAAVPIVDRQDMIRADDEDGPYRLRVVAAPDNSPKFAQNPLSLPVVLLFLLIVVVSISVVVIEANYNILDGVFRVIDPDEDSSFEERLLKIAGPRITSGDYDGDSVDDRMKKRKKKRRRKRKKKHRIPSTSRTKSKSKIEHSKRKRKKKKKSGKEKMAKKLDDEDADDDDKEGEEEAEEDGNEDKEDASDEEEGGGGGGGKDEEVAPSDPSSTNKSSSKESIERQRRSHRRRSSSRRKRKSEKMDQNRKKRHSRHHR